MSAAVPSRPTFRARLTSAMLGLALGALAAASATIYLGARHILATQLDETVLAIAGAELASALDSPEGSVHVHDEGPTILALSSGTGYEKIALIKNRDGVVVARTGNLTGEPPLVTDAQHEQRAFEGEPSFADVERRGARWRAIYHPLYDAKGARLVAVIAIPYAPVERALHALLAALGVALLVGTGAAAWGANRLAARLTRPLEAIAHAARRVGEDTLSARIPETAPDAELHTVTTILNAMLARLETAFATQRRFLADAAHELRSPLTNLRGTIEVALRRSRSPAEYHATLTTSLVEIERLGRLVETLLTLSRADAGRMDLRRSPCDLRALALASIATHTSEASRRGVGLRLDGDAPLALDADPDRVREVLDNLLDNALRHAPAASTIVLRVARDGDRATAAVTDTGPGLTAGEQAQVFDRFYRTDSARARSAGGTGLGLAIAKAIAEAHAGTLSVTSSPGAGATFTLTLPASPPSAARAPIRAPG